MPTAALLFAQEEISIGMAIGAAALAGSPSTVIKVRPAQMSDHERLTFSTRCEPAVA
ncbi:hypothetical protein [Mesorhizobium sp. AR07]|uniref:hypothetical protein n=1 Tax=Mesorhizobium sp. AR07 TaxID=2865838 RepID=UPI002160BF0D|nr:hypothetical protein [Mesorhizobium sp. AR07]